MRVVGIRQGETWAERVAVPVDSIGGIPDGVTFGQAAALATAGVTALRVVCGSGPPSSVDACW